MEIGNDDIICNNKSGFLYDKEMGGNDIEECGKNIERCRDTAGRVLIRY
jgi:hypothetical protein